MRNGSGQGQRRAPAAAQGEASPPNRPSRQSIATIWRLLRAMEVSADRTLQACVQAFERGAADVVVVSAEEAALGIPLEGVVDPLLAAAFRSARSQWQAQQQDDEVGSSSVRNQGELLVLGLLGTLDEPKRVALLLADMEQLSSPEIAALMGLRLDVVYDELRKARKTFVRARKRLDNASATGDAEAEARELLTLARTHFSPDAAALHAASQQLPVCD